MKLSEELKDGLRDIVERSMSENRARAVEMIMDEAENLLLREKYNENIYAFIVECDDPSHPIFIVKPRRAAAFVLLEFTVERKKTGKKREIKAKDNKT